MKNNEFDIFKDADDDMIGKIASEYPVLTDDEKERMFAMSERKYNNEENRVNGFENGTEVSGVEVYSRPKWYRFAAMAAAFVLVAGGVAGSVALGNRMKKTSPDKQPAAATEASQTATEADTVSTQPSTEEMTAAAVENTDRKAAAEELIRKYSAANDLAENRIGIDMSDEAVEITYSGGERPNDIPTSYYKVTDQKIRTMDDIREVFRGFFSEELTEKYMELYCGGDMSEAAKAGKCSDYDSMKTFVTINGELYAMQKFDKAGTGETHFVDIKDIEGSSFNADWVYEMYDGDIEKTLHIEFDEAVNDWRIYDFVEGGFYAGMPTEQEAYDAAVEFMTGFADKYNKLYGLDVETDANDKLVFKEQLCAPENADEITDQEYFLRDVGYTRVTSSGYRTSQEFRDSISAISDYYRSGSFINYDFDYPEGTLFTYYSFGDESLAPSDELSPFICVNDNIYMRDEYGQSGAVLMEKDPEIKNVQILGSNNIMIETKDCPIKLIASYIGDPDADACFYMTRKDSGKWRLVEIGNDSDWADIFAGHVLR